MYFVSINELAKQLISTNHNHSMPALNVFAEQIIIKACEVFNEGEELEDVMVDEFIVDYTEILPGVNMGEKLMEQVRNIRERAIGFGWDRRVKVTAKRIKRNENFFRYMVKMDLDKTVAYMLSSNEPEVVDSMELVSDNPTPEEMQQYDDEIRRRGLN